VSFVLEFENVVRAYRENEPVVDGVSFTVGQGEVVGLLGRNGAGKTTLIRLAIGLLHPQGGAVRAFGVAPTERPVEVKKRIGYVAEDQVLPGTATVKELIVFHRFLFPEWDMGLERQLQERFSMPSQARINTLSKGQARQVALLCAVCHRPELLLLDEPAGGLDPAARREFLETAIQLLNREGSAILFSSHQMSDVERIGARVVLIERGKVCLDRDLDRIREDFCVAMIPRSALRDAAALERAPGCLRVRSSFDSWHAVFEKPPEEVRAELQELLGVDGVHCVRMPLEDLFVEMVGGQR
jgi:ABC-2 type transport system ATP-binding protein